MTTAVVPFNDLDALDRRLAEGDVACLLMEPALTNIGIVLPDDGLPRRRPRDHPAPRRAAGHRRDAHALRRARRLHARLGARPRPLVVGKPIGGGVPSAAYGMTRGGRRPALRPDARPRDRRRRRRRHPHRQRPRRWPRSGPRSRPACARRTSRSPIPLAERFTAGVAGGDRASTTCPGTCSGSAAGRSTGSARRRATAPPRPPPSTRSSRASCTCGALNRGVLLTPFHNMALFSPHHTEADVDRHTEVFGEAVAALARLTGAARFPGREPELPVAHGSGRRGVKSAVAPWPGEHRTPRRTQPTDAERPRTSRSGAVR